ncbi:nuclear transport factor 2 family protein [Microbacterium sp. Bi128]|uniref:nuclear transport factor 2 family protein n=1 Tax=Microbacterium sp. Bi128 TaxID=2821115 RepID=UPI001D614E7E|nr:nuclear transport factor 2 family protein [Microbacterium sp. Bi128]CAH0220655.1 hypothetical protein SRABI128_02192 [Microbacterium sp. Bi128]
MTDVHTPYDPTLLPSPVVGYLDAREDHRHADATAAFSPDAIVIDDGRTYRGLDAISAWIATSSTEFTYTSSRLDQWVGDTRRAVVRVRLDGNFPGGIVLLRHGFQLAAGRIERLVIEV